MQINQLSTNGYLLTDVFSDELMVDILDAIGTFVPTQIQECNVTKREAFFVSKGTLRDKIVQALQPACANKILGIELWRDYPGYENPYHLDDPMVQNVMIIYMGDEELDIGTGYIEDNHYKVPYKKNTGIMLLNSNKISHGMVGKVPDGVIRKTVYLNWKNK